MSNPTPTMSHHARLRCAEMGISTKVAKRIVANPSTTYCGKPGSDEGTRVLMSAEYPDYAVVLGHRPGTEVPVVITVLFREQADYVRNGATYSVVTPSKEP